MAQLDPRIKGLADLARMLLDTELQSLSLLADSRSSLEDETSRMRQAIQHRAKSIKESQTPDEALRAGADEHWNRWMNSTLEQKNQSIAKILVEIEVQRETTKRAFGRAQILKKLARR